MTDILKRLTDYIAQCPPANGRTFHEMQEEVLIAHSADEIAKLRAALRDIALMGPYPWRCIARSALGEKKDD